jgi:hypothetical protein
MGKGISPVLKGLLRRRPPPVATAAALSEFLDRRAALVAQKSVIGYCHVKTQLPLTELITETRFSEAFERSRAEAHSAVLADLTVLTEGYLRAAAGRRAIELPERLAALYAAVLAAHPRPAHRPEGWAVAVEAVRERLKAAQAGPPRGAAAIAESSAEHLFRTLPIHERLREPDKPAIVANVKFLMVGMVHEFERQLDPAALAADLLPPEDAAA